MDLVPVVSIFKGGKKAQHTGVHGPVIDSIDQVGFYLRGFNGFQKPVGMLSNRSQMVVKTRECMGKTWLVCVLWRHSRMCVCDLSVLEGH